ncbi:MAG: helix-turn-helix transcriptional regulator [Rhizobiales bacterium]|nr:helix-turn-helix transcriptional regulator [Hyphomicrobiales bacterium]
MVGDRWTLVILRDMLNGKRRFSEFLNSPEQITTNVLSDRLVQMERNGLVLKATYQMRPKRYEYAPTEMAHALLPVLQQMSLWANRYVKDTWTPPESFMQRRVALSRQISED